MKKTIKSLNKIQIIFLISTIFITSCLSILDYQKNKDDPRYYTQLQRFANNIKDDLSYQNNYQYVVENNNTQRSFTGEIIAYNTGFYPTILSFHFASVIINYEDTTYYINFNNLEYPDLKRMSEQIKNLSNNLQDINITFNYDSINQEENTVIVNNLTYFKINDEELIDISIDKAKNNIMSAKVENFHSNFFHYNSSNPNEASSYYDYFDRYDYLMNFCKETIDEKKYNKNGFYEIIDPEDSPIKIDIYNDKDGNPVENHIRLCFLMLSLDNNDSVYQFNDESLDLLDPVGYLVWYEYGENFYTYSFTTYLLEHYYNYLIVLLFIIFIIYILQTYNPPKLEPLLNKQPTPRKKINHVEPLDLEPIINQMIKASSNLLTFKNIKIEFFSLPTLINGDKDKINQLVNELYNYMIRYSSSCDIITIRLENNRLTYYNPNLKDNKNDLIELSKCLEIISEHNFDYVIDQGKISFYEKKDTTI